MAPPPQFEVEAFARLANPSNAPLLRNILPFSKVDTLPLRVVKTIWGEQRMHPPPARCGDQLLVGRSQGGGRGVLAGRNLTKDFLRGRSRVFFFSLAYYA
jgi:hypothetical protein